MSKFVLFVIAVISLFTVGCNSNKSIATFAKEEAQSDVAQWTQEGVTESMKKARLSSTLHHFQVEYNTHNMSDTREYVVEYCREAKKFDSSLDWSSIEKNAVNNIQEGKKEDNKDI